MERMVGIRGATTVSENKSQLIINDTRELLKEIQSQNEICTDDVVSIFFSCTKDLNAAYPAVAARELGFTSSALFCCQEMDVPGSLPMCIRVLLHVVSEKTQKEVRHVYLKGARQLRPDLVQQAD